MRMEERLGDRARRGDKGWVEGGRQRSFDACGVYYNTIMCGVFMMGDRVCYTFCVLLASVYTEIWCNWKGSQQWATVGYY